MLKLFCIFDTNILFIGGHLLDFSGTLQKQWSKGDFYQKLVSFIKRICWRTLSLICHALLCSSCLQVYDVFKYKYYLNCLLGIYFSQFSQFLQCSCSAFRFLFLQCSAFAFLHFVLLIWGCIINLSDLF